MNEKFIQKLILLIGLWYVFLCTAHWLGQRPLWLDEFNVFLSVRDFRPEQFFLQKLEGGQIFPKLQLFLVQRVAEPWHLNLLGLRSVSFVSMVLGFVFWMTALRQSLSSMEKLTYTLSWAGTTLLVYYSAELKPYACDVFAAGAWMLFLTSFQKMRELNRVGYGLSLWLLPLLGFISYPATLFLIFPFYALCQDSLKDRFWWACFLGFGLSSLITIAGIYFFDLRYTHADTSSQGFDNHMITFSSLPEFFKSGWEGTVNLFCRFFAEQPRIYKKIAMPFGIGAFLYMLFAGVAHLRDLRHKLFAIPTIALVLYGELFVLGIMHKYPFSVPRTSLFFCPLVLYLIVKLLAAMKKGNRYLGLLLWGGYVVFLIVITFGLGQSVLTGNLGFAGPNL